MHKMVKLEDGELINNAWNHIVLEWEKDKAFRVYANGRVVYHYTGAERLSVAPTGQQFHIGSGNGRFLLDRMFFVDHVMGETAVGALYEEEVLAEGAAVIDFEATEETVYGANFSEIAGPVEGMIFSHLRYWDGPWGTMGYAQSGDTVWIEAEDGDMVGLAEVAVASGWDASVGSEIVFRAYDATGQVIGEHRVETAATDVSFQRINLRGIAGFGEAYRVGVEMIGGSVDEHLFYLDNMVFEREIYPVEIEVQAATDHWVAQAGMLTEEEHAAFYEPVTMVVYADGKEIGRDIITEEYQWGEWGTYHYRFSTTRPPGEIDVRFENDYYKSDGQGNPIVDRHFRMGSLLVNGSLLMPSEDAVVVYGETVYTGRNHLAATHGRLVFDMAGKGIVYEVETAEEKAFRENILARKQEISTLDKK